MNPEEFKKILNESLDEHFEKYDTSIKGYIDESFDKRFEKYDTSIKNYVDGAVDQLAGITKDNFVRLESDMQNGFKSVNERLDKIEFNTSGLSNRVSALEDQMRFVKTKLNFN